MIPKYTDKEYDDQSLKCDNCQWTGKGSDAVLIDFYGVTDTKELHCPNCDKTIALVTRNEEKDPPGESPSDLSFQFG
jgi:hypothetical protein